MLNFTEADQQFWDSWKNNIVNFFLNSSEARVIFKNKFTQQIYIKGFVDFVNNILDDYDKGVYTKHAWNK